MSNFPNIFPITLAATGTAGSALITLSAHTEYYVDTATGSDSNNGEVDTPWATVQHGIDWISTNVNANGFLITINILPGSYGDLYLRGVINSSAVVLSGTSTNLFDTVFDAFYADSVGRYNIKNLTYTDCFVRNSCIYVDTVNVYQIVFTDYGYNPSGSDRQPGYSYLWIDNVTLVPDSLHPEYGHGVLNFGDNKCYATINSVSLSGDMDAYIIGAGGGNIINIENFSISVITGNCTGDIFDIGESIVVGNLDIDNPTNLNIYGYYDGIQSNKISPYTYGVASQDLSGVITFAKYHGNRYNIDIQGDTSFNINYDSWREGDVFHVQTSHSSDGVITFPWDSIKTLNNQIIALPSKTDDQAEFVFTVRSDNTAIVYGGVIFPAISAIDVPLTIYVDSILGNDTYATRFNSAVIPFKTINAAKDASSAGDIIHVKSGTYDEYGLLKDGISYYFEDGAIVKHTGNANAGTTGYISIFSDNDYGAAATCDIDGYGTFIVQPETADYPIAVFRFYNSSSVIKVRCKSVQGYTENDADFNRALATGNIPTITFEADECVADVPRWFIRLYGNSRANVKRMHNTRTTCVQLGGNAVYTGVEVSDAASGGSNNSFITLYDSACVSVEKYISGQIGLFQFSGAGRSNVDIKYFEAAVSAQYNILSGYANISIGKIYSPVDISGLISSSAGHHNVHVGNVESGGTCQLIFDFSGGSHSYVADYVTAATEGSVFVGGTGTDPGTTIYIGSFTAPRGSDNNGTRGIVNMYSSSSKNVTIGGRFIATGSDADSYGLYIDDNSQDLKLENGTVFIVGSGVTESMYSPSAQAIKINGTVILNKDVNANITYTYGSSVVNTGVN